MIAVLLLVGVAASQPQAKPEYAPEVRTIIERGIEAHGGAKQLEKLSQNWRTKVRGKTNKLEITGEIFNGTNHKSKLTTTLHSWIPVSVTVVDNGERAWKCIGGFTSEVTGKELAEMRDGEYRHHVRNLFPLLREPGFTVTLLPETTVASQPAAGIRVQSNGHRDIDLYFDKSTGVVVKTESRILAPGKPPIVLEQILSNYRDFDGLKLATTFTKFENKKQSSVEEYVDFKFVDKLDEHEFDKP